MVRRAKWVAEGCNTLLAVAERSQSEAEKLTEMHNGGHVLENPVADDYAFIKPPC